MTETKKTLIAIFEEAGARLHVEFCRPFEGEAKREKLQYRILVIPSGGAVFNSFYFMGSGHCPAYNTKESDYKNKAYSKKQAIQFELDEGKSIKDGKAIRPDPDDVIAALLNDASAYEGKPDFEEFFFAFGYEAKTPQDLRDARAAFENCKKAYQFLSCLLGAQYQAAQEIAREM